MEGQGQRSRMNMPLAWPAPDAEVTQVHPGCLLYWRARGKVVVTSCGNGFRPCPQKQHL